MWLLSQLELRQQHYDDSFLYLPSPILSFPLLQAQAGVQRALQLLLVIIDGCGSNEINKVSDRSAVAMLVDAARLPQTPCKQLALQTLSKILSANPDETCTLFHDLGGTSIAMEVIRKNSLFPAITVELMNASMAFVMLTLTVP